MAETFIFYKSWYDLILEEYPDKADQDVLIRALVEYGISGVQTYPMEKMFLKQAYCQIDSAKSKWEDIRQKRSDAGKAGKGSSKARYGNQNATKRNKTQDNVNVHVNVNENNPSTLSSLKGKRGKVLTDEEAAELFGLDSSECMKIWREQQNENTETDL